MKKINTILKLTIMLIVIGTSNAIAQTFVHPGTPFTRDDLNQLKENIDESKERQKKQV